MDEHTSTLMRAVVQECWVMHLEHDLNSRRLLDRRDALRDANGVIACLQHVGASDEEEGRGRCEPLPHLLHGTCLASHDLSHSLSLCSAWSLDPQCTAAGTRVGSAVLYWPHHKTAEDDLHLELP